MPDDSDAPLVVCPTCRGSGSLLTCPLCKGQGVVPDPDSTDLDLDCSGAAAEVGGEREGKS